LAQKMSDCHKKAIKICWVFLGSIGEKTFSVGLLINFFNQPQTRLKWFEKHGVPAFQLKWLERCAIESRNSNHINPDRLQLNRFIPIEHDLRVQKLNFQLNSPGEHFKLDL